MNNPLAQSFSVRAAKGVGWLVAARLIARGIDGLVLIMLARLLVPSDFGVVAMAMTVVYIVESVLDLPVTQVLLRLPSISKSHLDTAFTLSVLRSALVVALLLALAHPLAEFDGEPRLVLLLSALACAPALRGLSSPGMVRFAQALDFRRDCVLEVSSKVGAGLIAIYLATTVHSYWAIAAGTIANPACMTFLSYVFAPYRPSFRIAEWKTFSHYVGWNFVTQFMTAGSWQMDRLFLGRYVTGSEFGTYAISNDVANLPYQGLIVPTLRPLNTAMYSLASDLPRLARAYLKSSSAVTLLGAPLFVGLAVLADPVVRLLLGPQWYDARPLLAIIALSYVLMLPTSTWTSLALVRGRVNFATGGIAVELLFRLPLTLFLTMYFGVYGAVYARLIMSLVQPLIAMFFVRRLSNLSIFDQLRAPARPLLAAGIMGGLLSLARPALAELPVGYPLAVGCAFAVVTGAVIYTGFAIALWHAAGRPSGMERMALDMLSRVPRKLRR